MLIDWFTVIAQIINFLVLAWLLKRFLYHPILNAIDAREKRIVADIADADKKKSEAEQQQAEFLEKNGSFDKQKSARMEQVKADAKTEHKRLFEAVRLESEELRDKLQSALKVEQLSLKEELSHRLRDELFAIARKVLVDLAGTTLEARMTEIFITRLGELSDDEVSAIKSNFSGSTKPLVIRTAFPLPKEQCALIETATKKILGGKIQIEYATDQDLVSGIEISVNGQKLAWSIGDFLSELTKSVDQLLQPSDKDNAKTKDKTKDDVDIIKPATTKQS